jgi:hypothetical protein
MQLSTFATVSAPDGHVEIVLRWWLLRVERTFRSGALTAGFDIPILARCGARRPYCQARVAADHLQTMVLLPSKTPHSQGVTPTQPAHPTRDISPSLSQTVISQDRTCMVAGNRQRHIKALRGLMIEGEFYNQWPFCPKTLSASGGKSGHWNLKRRLPFLTRNGSRGP